MKTWKIPVAWTMMGVINVRRKRLMKQSKLQRMMQVSFLFLTMEHFLMDRGK